MSEEENELSEQKMGFSIPGMDVLHQVQKVLEIVDAVKNADANGNGVPDWADLLQIAQEMFKELDAFKGKVVQLTVAEVVPATQAFLAKMMSLYNEATKLIGDDVDGFKDKFPDLIAEIEKAQSARAELEK